MYRNWTANSCWFVFGVLLGGGICFGIYASLPTLFGTPAGPGFDSMISGGAGLLVVGFVAILLGAFTAAVTATARMWRNQQLRELVPDLVHRLDSPQPLDRIQALQVLADLAGEPFGPLAHRLGSPTQLEMACLLYREWWQTESEYDSPLVALKRDILLRRVIVRARALRDEANLSPSGDLKHPEANPAWGHLPLLPPERLVAALRPRVEETLHRVAGIINLACKDLPFSHSESRVLHLFTELCWETFERGWQLRFDAAEGRLPPLPAARQPEVEPKPPPAPAPARPPSVGWAEKYRRINAPETGPEGTAEPAGRPGEMTWGELAEALRHKVDETLDRLNEAIKDALIDGELPLPADGDAEDPRPLTPLSQEGFIEAMRPRIEEALRGMADSLNESGAAERVGDLLEALLHDALQTGLEMRLHPPPADAPVPQESLH
jgi:hypothetical protein